MILAQQQQHGTTTQLQSSNDKTRLLAQQKEESSASQQEDPAENTSSRKSKSSVQETTTQETSFWLAVPNTFQLETSTPPKTLEEEESPTTTNGDNDTLSFQPTKRRALPQINQTAAYFSHFARDPASESLVSLMGLGEAYQHRSSSLTCNNQPQQYYCCEDGVTTTRNNPSQQFMMTSQSARIMRRRRRRPDDGTPYRVNFACDEQGNILSQENIYQQLWKDQDHTEDDAGATSSGHVDESKTDPSPISPPPINHNPPSTFLSCSPYEKHAQELWWSEQERQLTRRECGALVKALRQNESYIRALQILFKAHRPEALEPALQAMTVLLRTTTTPTTTRKNNTANKQSTTIQQQKRDGTEQDPTDQRGDEPATDESSWEGARGLERRILNDIVKSLIRNHENVTLQAATRSRNGRSLDDGCDDDDESCHGAVLLQDTNGVCDGRIDNVSWEDYIRQESLCASLPCTTFASVIGILDNKEAAMVHGSSSFITAKSPCVSSSPLYTSGGLFM